MNAFTASPVFGVSMTVMFYAAGLALQKKLSWAHPLITTCGRYVRITRTMSSSGRSPQIFIVCPGLFENPVSTARVKN